MRDGQEIATGALPAC